MIFNAEKYGALLSATLPVSIKTDEEHERMISAVGDLMKKGEENISPEESRLIELLADIIGDYEKRVYQPIEKSEPVEVLKFLMKENDLRQKDLLDVFGSVGIASEVLNGKRGISKAHAKKLAGRFRVSAELFI